MRLNPCATTVALIATTVAFGTAPVPIGHFAGPAFAASAARAF
jgi:hypothetical protein